MAGEPATVLVVDDDPSLRLLCRVNLELEGYRVIEAESVESAVAALKEEQIDAILLDVHLGNDDGLALLPTIEEGGPRVALLTGSPGVHLPEGATVIGKPFSIGELTDTVGRLVGR
ncbi:MAG TPA: response regulator [Gaiellaceae bacterium]|jgi:DNA-binding NtrC family response regulator